MMPRDFDSINDAYELLENLGAPPKLLLHVKLVGEAAEILVKELRELKIPFDQDFVRFGAAFHDAGKIVYTSELSAPGDFHEAAGEKLLLENGVDERLARVCRSHGKWETIDCSFEEYVIALADKLWKGKRENVLEETVIDRATELLKTERWKTFVSLDSCFERIASEGDERLNRSRNY